jgi:hypothetical protein
MSLLYKLFMTGYSSNEELNSSVWQHDHNVSTLGFPYSVSSFVSFSHLSAPTIARYLTFSLLCGKYRKDIQPVVFRPLVRLAASLFCNFYDLGFHDPDSASDLVADLGAPDGVWRCIAQEGKGI